MDELWVVLVIIISIVSGVLDNRKKKAARKAVAEAEAAALREIRESKEKTENRRKEPMAEIVEPVVDVLNIPDNIFETRRWEVHTDSAVSEAKVLSEVQEAQEYIAKRHASHRNKASKTKVTDNISENFAEDIVENFDLRRAVIYSEIMKPKFDDII